MALRANFAVIKYEGVKRIHTNEDFIFSSYECSSFFETHGAPVEVQIAAYLKMCLKLAREQLTKRSMLLVRVANLVAEMTDSDVERAKAGVELHTSCKGHETIPMRRF